MRAWSRLLTICIAGVAMLAVVMPAANAKYPFKCPKNRVLVLNHDDASATPVPLGGFATIQEAIEAADGTPAAAPSANNPVPSDSGGDTVIICSGTYMENVVVPTTDTGGSNSDITIRSFDDGSNPIIFGTVPGEPVFDIDAPGVLLGGTHLGFEITGVSTIGIQVGTPNPIDFDQDDDQDDDVCDTDNDPDECNDLERVPFETSNVSIIGNEIRNLGNGTSSVTGIAVNNTNNTLIFRNKVDNLETGAGETATGILYSDSNYNNDVISNAVKDLSQTGGTCGGSSLEFPTAGAVGISIGDEALDAMVDRNLVEDIESSCTAIGVYSNAWGGLENTRNGQQIPIVTDILDNRIKHTEGTGLNQSAGVALAPITPTNDEDENDPENAPSSFRVLANDLDDHNGIAVAVLAGMAPNSYIRENDFDHNQVGILNNSGFNVDATNNWWGCDEGPRVGLNTKKECSTIENGGVSTTSFTPWLKHHAAHAGAHAGEYAGH